MSSDSAMRNVGLWIIVAILLSVATVELTHYMVMECRKQRLIGGINTASEILDIVNDSNLSPQVTLDVLNVMSKHPLYQKGE